MSCLTVIILLLSICSLYLVEPLLTPPRHTVSRYIAKSTALQTKPFHDFAEDDSSNRRLFLKHSGAYLTGMVTCTRNAYASGTATLPDLDCLLDLPPVTPDCARLYLCRHGQTENNRLHLVQGARVDPPINNFGFEQARRLGMAISRLSSSNEAAAIPSIVTHSKMQRARMTAETLTSIARESWASPNMQPKLIGELPSLGEVDFGSLEGTDSKKAKRQMMSTFASWAIGDVDKKLAGGESGRDVLIRAVEALEELSKAAVASSTVDPPSILAVSHSTYLRVLISLVNDSPLAQSAFLKINNGSVNVVDVNIKGKKRAVNLNSGLFGGGRGLGLLPRGNSQDVDVVMPESYLIRTNEVRHLNGMVV